MSETVQKPKPRPRPRPRVVASKDEGEKLGSSSKSLAEDEDDKFIRNRKRNARAWSKINAVVEKREAARVQPIDIESSDSDSSRTNRTRRPPFTAKAKKMPAWTKSDGLIQIQDSDSESDSGASNPQIPREASSPQVSPDAKRKRKLSESSSDSAESAVLAAEYIGRERARAILGSHPSRREPSPAVILGDDEETISDLPPELAAIKAEVIRKSAKPASLDNSASSAGSIELKITLRPHPEDESGKSYIYSHTMRRNEKFEQLFAEIADAGGIPSEKLVILFNNHRVYPWSTPQTLSIWSEAELVTYEEHVYKYIKAHGYHSAPVDDFSAAPLPSSSQLAPAESDTELEASQDKADAFKLQVRCGEKTTMASVRPTTKCGAIVANVLRKIGKPLMEKARIEVDGEKLSPETEIGEADLEEGDLIDIVGA